MWTLETSEAFVSQRNLNFNVGPPWRMPRKGSLSDDLIAKILHVHRWLPYRVRVGLQPMGALR